jgi:hypothetical protein
LNLNKPFGKKKKKEMFHWAEIGQPKLETGDSFPHSSPVVHRLILAITSDEASQGVVRGHDVVVGDSPEAKRNGGGFQPEGNGGEQSNRRSLMLVKGSGGSSLAAWCLRRTWWS